MKLKEKLLSHPVQPIKHPDSPDSSDLELSNYHAEITDKFEIEKLNPAPKPSKALTKPKVGRRVLAVRHDADTHTNIFGLSELRGELMDTVEKFENLDMDQMLEFVGTAGRYQYTIVALASFMSIIMSMILYASSYLLAEPGFKCYVRKLKKIFLGGWECADGLLGRVLLREILFGRELVRSTG
jgi:hypothetical protein